MSTCQIIVRPVFESNTYVFTENDLFIKNGYVAKELFKMNIIYVLKNFKSNKSFNYVHLLESFYL